WDAPGAGIAVQPNGMRVLRALGLGAAVERAGAVLRCFGFCDQPGEALCESNLERVWGAVGPFIGIERHALHEVLLAGAAAVPHRLGLSVQALTPTGDRIDVRFTDDSVGTYDLVVGADGIASTVRTLALSDQAPAYAGQMAWRSIAPIRPRGLDGVRFLLGEGCIFGLCPTGDRRTYGFGNASVPRFHDPLEGRLARLRERFSAFGSIVKEVLDALSADQQIHCSPIEWLSAETWRAGRVVLIGDAAHASLPMMGQGGWLAVEDAYVLAEGLADADDVDRALDAFVARRTPRVGWVADQSAAIAAA